MKKDGQDIAVPWIDRTHCLQRIRKLGGVPLYGYPRRLKVPGGKVAIVGSGKKVRILFTASDIVGPKRVILVGGKATNRGYIVTAKPKSMRYLGNDGKKLNIRGWHKRGQIRYIDYNTGRAVYPSNTRANGSYIDDEIPDALASRQMRMIPYEGGIPGRPHDDPENQLVKAYKEWLNRPERVGHYYLRGPRMPTDLFDFTYWRLIEAKANVKRETIRTALGQLLDYKRFIRRRPSLGVLVPERPSPSIIEFLRSYKVTVVWQTPAGRFGDSAQGRWTERI